MARVPKAPELIFQFWLNQHKHANCSIDQKGKILRAFQDFKTTAEIGGLRDITPEAVIRYKDAMERT